MYIKIYFVAIRKIIAESDELLSFYRNSLICESCVIHAIVYASDR